MYKKGKRIAAVLLALTLLWQPSWNSAISGQVQAEEKSNVEQEDAGQQTTDMSQTEEQADGEEMQDEEAIQEAQVASERARNAKYQVALENAKAETRAAQNALSKAMTKPLDQAINEARIASLTEENRKLKEENSRLRQALQRLTDFVREKAPSWLRDFMAKANELLPMKQRHQGLDR